MWWNNAYQAQEVETKSWDSIQLQNRVCYKAECHREQIIPTFLDQSIKSSNLLSKSDQCVNPIWSSFLYLQCWELPLYQTAMSSVVTLQFLYLRFSCSREQLCKSPKTHSFSTGHEKGHMAANVISVLLTDTPISGNQPEIELFNHNNTGVHGSVNCSTTKYYTGYEQ